LLFAAARRLLVERLDLADEPERPEPERVEPRLLVFALPDRALLVGRVVALAREDPFAERFEVLFERGAEPFECPLPVALRSLREEDLLVAIPHPSFCRELPPGSGTYPLSRRLTSQHA
jgi:hypothetical protein